MSAAALLGVEWARPLALLALALPVALLLASRLHERPVEIATGTLDLWKRVLAARPPPSGRARRRIPPAVWLLAAALALGALALAGPARPAKSSRALRVLVDRSPSMELPLGSGTRRERALAMANAWIDANLPRGSPIEWIDREEPFGPDDDRPDTLWVTDRAPEPPPARAGFVASGGSAVPGPIALDGTTRYDWDGERIAAVRDGAPQRSVAVIGELPRPIADVLAAWAQARGARIAPKYERGVSLGLTTAVSGSRRDLDVGRDGWSARAAVLDVPIDLTTWLEDAEHRTLVAWRPGLVASAIVSLDDPRGDPAAFAVSWAQLFDSAVLPPPGIVELAERRAAGAEATVAPRAAGDEGPPPGSRSGAAALALVAAVCAALAAALARSGRIE